MSLLFAGYSCGNRHYMNEGNTAPATCPHDGCDGTKEGVWTE